METSSFQWNQWIRQKAQTYPPKSTKLATKQRASIQYMTLEAAFFWYVWTQSQNLYGSGFVVDR